LLPSAPIDASRRPSTRAAGAPSTCFAALWQVMGVGSITRAEDWTSPVSSLTPSIWTSAGSGWSCSLFPNFGCSTVGDPCWHASARRSCKGTPHRMRGYGGRHGSWSCGELGDEDRTKLADEMGRAAKAIAKRITKPQSPLRMETVWRCPFKLYRLRSNPEDYVINNTLPFDPSVCMTAWMSSLRSPSLPHHLSLCLIRLRLNCLLPSAAASFGHCTLRASFISGIVRLGHRSSRVSFVSGIVHVGHRTCRTLHMSGIAQVEHCTIQAYVPAGLCCPQLAMDRFATILLSI
jgi:hypothetical protein